MSELAQLAELAESAENDLMYAAIFSPDYGEREDVPTIMLPDAFTAENVNVLLRKGAIERAKMKLPEFIESAYVDGTGTLTATNGSKTLTATSGAGAWGSGANHKPYWTGRTITITDGGVPANYTISSVNDDGSEITLSANYTGTGGAGLAYSIGTAGTKVQTPDGNPILHHHRLVQRASGSELEWVLAYTKAHVYLWSTVWSAWMLKFTCASDCERWETAELSEKVISTNNVDKIQIWGATTTNAFAVADSSSGLDTGGSVYVIAAKHIVEYEGYIIVGHITLNSSVVEQEAIYWCSKDDETDWDQTGSGDCGMAYVRGGGGITGFGKYAGEVVIGKEERMFRLWLVLHSSVFNIEDLIVDVGCRSADSMINGKDGQLYWLSDDYQIRVLPGGESVSTAMDSTFQTINPELESLIKSTFINEYGLLLWSLPIGADATANNKVIWFDPLRGRWGEIDSAIASFGQWRRQQIYTWGTLPYTQWSLWAWESWSEVENVVGYAIDLGSDYSGYSYALHSSELDDSSSYTGYFVLSTDLLEKVIAKRYGLTLMQYKRIHTMQLYFYSENAGTCSVSVKRDNETDWQSVGSVNLVDADRDIAIVDLAADIRLRHSLIKISGANRFRFLGIIFGFLPDGSN